MARRELEDDDWDDSWRVGDWEPTASEFEVEDDDPDDLPEEDEAPTVPCKYCQETIPEDAPRCPYCENYLSDEDAPPARKPWWIVIGVLVCLYIVYRWVVGPG